MNFPTFRKRFTFFTTLVSVLVVSFIVTGCGVTTSNESEPPEFTSYPFEDTVVWPDGLEITVGTPTPFDVSPTVMTADKSGTNVLFEMSLTNNTGKDFFPLVLPSVVSGGVTSAEIFDAGNDLGHIGTQPMSTMSDGETITWITGFNVQDVNDIVYSVAPTPEYDNFVFTNTINN